MALPDKVMGRLVTLDMVSAGDHCSFRMSKQMLPWLFTFG